MQYGCMFGMSRAVNPHGRSVFLNEPPHMKNTKYHTVYLPCKPYIRKYILSRYGYPFVATNKTTFGSFVNLCLEKNIYTNEALYQPVLTKHYTEKLAINISNWQFVRIGFDFSPEKVIELNRFIEAMFEDHLCDFVSVKFGVVPDTRKELINAFAKMYNIEPEYDISMNALVKIEYRRRQEIEKAREQVAKAPELFA